MTYNSSCPVCQNTEALKLIRWNQYSIIHCNRCELDYCAEMVEKEIGGDSSPVNSRGVKMMAEIFHRTNEIANLFVIKRKNIYESLLKRNCSQILEVGCGPGVFYKPWSNLDVKWTGIDINPYWKEFGEKNGVPISNNPIHSLKTKYDVIMAHQVIEHVEDPIIFMKNIKALLNPGGIVHLELPNQSSLMARLRKISSIISNDYGFIQPPMHLRAYHEKTIEYLFNIMNFKSKMIFVCGNTDKTWGQVREYDLLQKLMFHFSGKIGLGSLLMGVLN